MTNVRALQLLHEAQVYLPAVVPDFAGGGFYVFSSLKVLGHGATIEEAMHKAGFLPPKTPPRTLFLVDRDNPKNILRFGEFVASAVSRSLAQRICNALNLYNPNERGF